MTNKYFLAVLIFFSLNHTAFSQAGPEEIVKKFFSDFETSGSSVALDNLYATNEWMELNQEAIENLKEKMGTLTEDVIGTYYGYELIATNKFSSVYEIHSYLVKYDRQPIRFVFQFYKPTDRWRIYSFEYDGNFVEQMKESVLAPD